MAARENLPRLIREIQDITSRLFEEFSNTGEPITDDNHVLHRFCVKLEYLLQTCMKEKSILGGTKSYWQWMYDSLKRTKGLSDGLKYVRANKEVRTSQGRGRALVRYSLVHQTLADSFQNCLMNAVICSQYLKPNSVLSNPTYGRAFVNALYELNAVHFDLISKGYDLDAAWPTFASKRHPSAVDQWRPPGRSSSLGSLNSMVSHITSTSIVMDTPQMRGVRSGGSFVGYGPTGSNGVDHRVEELVLELDQSDQKIREQQETLSRLESDAVNMAKSAGEKEDILARVISDLESRNQNLQDAMSNMSTEFQNREVSWKNKHSEITTSLHQTTQENEKMKNRISVLEQDKRNLEDTVSARMSKITSGFSGTGGAYGMVLTPTDETGKDHAAKLEESLKERDVLERQLYDLRLGLVMAEKKIEAEKEALSASLTAEFEAKESEWNNRLENATANVATQFVLKLSTLLPEVSDEFALSTQSPHQQVQYLITKLSDMANEYNTLKQDSLVERNTLQHAPCQPDIEPKEWQEKYDVVVSERDDALAEVRDLHKDLVDANEELQNYKLKLEAVLSEQQHSAVELRDKNFRLEDEITKEKQLKSEAVGNARKWQSKNGNDGTETLHSGSSLPSESESLVEELSSLQNEKDRLERELLARQDELSNANLSVQQLTETLSRTQTQLEDSNAEKHHYEHSWKEQAKKFEESFTSGLEQAKKIESLEKELHELNEKDKNSEALVELLQQGIQQLNEEKDAALSDSTSAKEKVSEELQKVKSEYELKLKDKTDALADMETEQKRLEGNLSMKEKELAATNFEFDTVKACMEEERTKSKQEYDEIVGENESRKRMIKSFESKLENLQKENKELLSINQALQKVEEDLKEANERKEELAISSNAIEEEFIKVVQKLEEEREELTKFKDQISEGQSREEGLKNEAVELNSVISDLKVKLIQLLQEKDSLWKECDELRYLQKLQEEGEETDGKWMEDQEARYCLHCGTQFSFIIRKHHCRICGKIFCNNCSKQWIITKTDGKHERCCLSCLELHKNKNEMKLLQAEMTQPGDAASSGAENKEDSEHGDNVDYETITDEELKEAKDDERIYDEDSPSKSVDDSIYSTPNAKMSDSGNFSSVDNLPSAMPKEESNPGTSDDKRVVVSAGESLRLPVVVESPGTTLFWKFSTDRSIDFQLSYCQSEGDDEKQLIPRCRCNSHSEPVEGEILSKKPGIYILEFDNKFSRFMSKEVSYTLRVNDRPVT